MRKIAHFLLLAVLLLAFASCNMEKRLYRNGWYIEKNKPHTFTANPASNPAPDAFAYEQPEQLASVPGSVAADSSVATNNVIDPVIKSQVPDSTLSKKDPKTMSRRELIKSMKEKGCKKPDQTADLLYWLAIASICLCWMLPLALILALVVIALSDSAEKDVIAKGECPRENLALISKARRLAKGLLFVSLFVAIALMGLLIAGLIVLLAGIF